MEDTPLAKRGRESYLCQPMSQNSEQLRAALADRYQLERPLAEAGMATVYLAQDRKRDRKVAAKVLRPQVVLNWFEELRTKGDI